MQEIPKDIIQKAASGDMEAFESIYNAAKGFVYSVALRIVHSQQDAEEVTQDVFVNVYKNLKFFRFQSSLKTWIYRVAVNAALNRYKRNSRQQERLVVMDEIVQMKTTAPQIEGKMNQEDCEEKVQNLLKQLNSDQRVCVILRNIQGLSYQEIADTLKININTVRTRLKRARERLLRIYPNKAVGHELR